MINNIGTNLKFLRKKNNLTLRDLSSLSNVSISYLSDIENSRKSPSIKTLTKLANALKIEVTDFFDNDIGCSHDDDYTISDELVKQVIFLLKEIDKIVESKNFLNDKDLNKFIDNLESEINACYIENMINKVSYKKSDIDDLIRTFYESKSFKKSNKLNSVLFNLYRDIRVKE